MMQDGEQQSARTDNSARSSNVNKTHLNTAICSGIFIVSMKSCTHLQALIKAQ